MTFGFDQGAPANKFDFNVIQRGLHGMNHFATAQTSFYRRSTILYSVFVSRGFLHMVVLFLVGKKLCSLLRAVNIPSSRNSYQETDEGQETHVHH